ncbi:hypothetical protein ACGC1H_005322 [Rhizoctonia solani]
MTPTPPRAIAQPPAAQGPTPPPALPPPPALVLPCTHLHPPKLVDLATLGRHKVRPLKLPRPPSSWTSRIRQPGELQNVKTNAIEVNCHYAHWMQSDDGGQSTKEEDD